MSSVPKRPTERRGSPLLRQLLLLAIVAAWGIGYLEPALSRADLQSQEWEQTRRLAGERRGLIAQRREIIDRYRKVATRQNVPEASVDETSLMRALATQAGNQKVQIVRINPVPQRAQQGLREIGAEIQVSGQAEEIVRFLYELENGTDPLVLKQLNLRVPAGKTRELEARLVAVKYLQ